MSCWAELSTHTAHLSKATEGSLACQRRPKPLKSWSVRAPSEPFWSRAVSYTHLTLPTILLV
eukprot:6746423-Pyramimonas_sp.AAC.1